MTMQWGVIERQAPETAKRYEPKWTCFRCGFSAEFDQFKLNERLTCPRCEGHLIKVEVKR